MKIMQRLIRKLTNILGNEDIFIQTWIPYSLIEFLRSVLNLFMTKCNWYKSTILCVFLLSFYACKIKKYAMFAEINKKLAVIRGQRSWVARPSLKSETKTRR